MLSWTTSPSTIEFKTGRPYQLSQGSQSIGDSKLICHGWLPMNFTIGKHTATQQVYFCIKADHFYFSKKGWLDIHILPSRFPYQMDIANSAHTSPASVATASTTQIKPPADTTTLSTSTTHLQLPQQPLTLPHPATPENILKLEQYLLDQFCDMTFNCSTLFPVILTKPAHIHLKEGEVAHAQQTPIPIPLHWKPQVKALDQNVTRWDNNTCRYWHPNHLVQSNGHNCKKDDTARRMVDLQHLA